MFLCARCAERDSGPATAAAAGPAERLRAPDGGARDADPAPEPADCHAWRAERQWRLAHAEPRRQRARHESHVGQRAQPERRRNSGAGAGSGAGTSPGPGTSPGTGTSAGTSAGTGTGAGRAAERGSGRIARARPRRPGHHGALGRAAVRAVAAVAAERGRRTVRARRGRRRAASALYAGDRTPGRERPIRCRPNVPLGWYVSLPSAFCTALPSHTYQSSVVSFVSRLL